VGDLRNARLIYLKGVLFLVLALGCIGLTTLERDSAAMRLGLARLLAWASARFYYFLFYVIEKYLDPGYKFSGVLSFVKHLAGRNRRRQ